MKVFISCDLEGVGGVISGPQTGFGGKDYDLARKWLTAEVNAAVEGAFEAGASDVLVTDGHGDMRNLLPDNIHPDARVILGDLKPLVQVQGAHERADAAFLIGYHPKNGTIGGVIDHTFYGSVVHELRINNRVFGETGLSALVLGHYGTPVVMVAGDNLLAKEAKAFLGPKIETAVVKEGITRYCAKNMHPTKAQKLIKDAAIRAIHRIKEFKTFTVKAPLTLQICFANSAMADLVATMPGTKRNDGLTVSFKAKDPCELYNMVSLMCILGSSAVRR